MGAKEEGGGKPKWEHKHTSFTMVLPVCSVQPQSISPEKKDTLHFNL